MMTLQLTDIANAIEARLVGEDCTITAVSTDTRQLAPGSLFVALRGERFDAHDFCDQAFAAGASALLVEHELPLAIPQLIVSDTLRGLGRLGRLVRQRVNPKVLAITGSCGKTTVKEMASAILSHEGRVLATAGNFNNEVGVPLTLLRLEPEHNFAVMELGANHKGEIAWTTSLALPDAAIINNVAAAHLEGFGSLEGIYHAKSEIFEGLGEGGTAIVNADNEFWPKWRERGIRCAFSIEDQTQPFHARDIRINAAGCAEFVMVTPDGKVALTLAIPGRHNIANALSAAAGCQALGASLASIKAGLERMAPVKGRFCVQRWGGLTLIDDTYNASVESVLAGIDALREMAGYRVLVFGDMRELGAESAEQHARVGRHARECGLDAVLTVGEESRHTADAAGGRHFDNKASLYEVLATMIETHTEIAVLVKGARGSRMEEIVEMVKHHQEQASC
ncbi:UDP-N-acetylmuramoyl-tripeptide--D-alanyl-D-alanine ligase [Aeromonas schubertii]|uniref:UDP-N-acetylmuramoyl-tripeptide--D-alanyl-D- alanine ligase n=1 Tax=Aeromonas schubertii TaxID=652 RepID=UPI0010A8EC9D|nr:UDP-N-acetylmuramoyl-tripeptide--D-alanyl-D-alanine ligase [Aeromonas schubertii]QCG49215.1 UDP-N-acetylmuramoyl-tripeptide--D-alanyl-D-alanine ligase [Aeromonas schubertii]